MFLFPEIIFHTGTVNILFVQEKNQWVVRSSELQSVVDFRIWVRFLCHVKGRYVFLNQCYIIRVFSKPLFSLDTVSSSEENFLKVYFGHSAFKNISCVSALC